MGASANVLVVCDASRGTLAGMPREQVSFARRLADTLGGSVDLLAFGIRAEDALGMAGAAGADRVCAIAGIERPGYHPEAFAAAALRACAELAPRLVVTGHGPLGLDLAPRVAFGWGARWVTNCTGAAFDDHTLVCQRHEVGGKVHLVERVVGPAVVTLRPKCAEPLPLAEGRQASLISVSAPPAEARTGIVFLERKREDGGAAKELEAASIIVTGGLGLGSAEAFTKLQALADALGASLAGSKQAVDRGWIPASRQVGLTGTTVAPRLYVAVGVSGALQHMAGCQKSRTIVAINSDPAAPIFRFATYGIVGKWEEVIPALIAGLPGNA